MIDLLRRFLGARAGAPTPKRRRRAAIGPRRRRVFSRHALQLPAVVRAGRRTVEGMSGSLGLGGLFLVCANPLPPHTPVTVELELPAAQQGAIQARGAVAYSAANGMGIRFTGLSHADCRNLRALFVRGAGV
jgi:hypothetical protein